MDANASKLIMQAVYISIFIMATGVTISMFSTINDFTENVSEVVRSDSISETVKENENVYLDVETLSNTLEYTVSGAELYTIVNNYGICTSGYAKGNEFTTTNYKYGTKYDSIVGLEYFVVVTGVSSIHNIDLKATYTVADLYVNSYNQKVIVYVKK